MSFYECLENGCDVILRSKKHARRHYQRVHAAEPEIEKDTPEYEQRDFEGNEPTEEGHNPQYETDTEESDTEEEKRLTTLQEHTREEKSLEEYDNE